jgi:hypothetical protein
MGKLIYVIKGKVKSFLLNGLGWSLTKAANLEDFKKIIKSLESAFINVPLMRIGESYDGGYLVPKIIEDCNVLFSPGVAETYDFEIALWEKFRVRSFMIDASVSGPVGHDYMSFKPLFLKSESDDNESITLEDWLKETGEWNSDNRKILQMDIEGGEYEVLSNATPELLARFDIILVEFHFLTDCLNTNGLLLLKSALNNLLTNFYVCHLHGNNCDRTADYNGFKYPECIEISFLRKDLATRANPKTFQGLPDELDFPNDPSKQEIELNKLWGNL